MWICYGIDGLVAVFVGIQHWEVAACWSGEEEDQTGIWAKREASWYSEENVNYWTMYLISLAFLVITLWELVCC